jgi:benzil reductase ((S)-benzoin forming)
MKLYVITGTTKGIGAALVDCLLESDQNVIVEISRHGAGRALSGKNARNAFIDADFADIAALEHSLQLLPAHVANRKFSHAYLLNNAGVVQPVDRFDRLDAQDLARNINVNVTAPMVIAKAFANATRERAPSRMIVNISSGAAKRPVVGWSAYCTSKAALEMATRALALDAATHDPTLVVCSLAPGVVDTPMQSVIRETTLEAFPDRERFRQMKEDGVLRDASAVARDMIKLLDSNKFTNGGNFDIREIL